MFPFFQSNDVHTRKRRTLPLSTGRQSSIFVELFITIKGHCEVAHSLQPAFSAGGEDHNHKGPLPQPFDRLPAHLVGLVALPEVEAGGEVAAEEWLLLDVGQESLIDGLLVCGAGAGDLLLLFETSIPLV